MRKKSKLSRVDENFLKELGEVRMFRASMGDDPRSLSDRELTRMTLNAESWRTLKEELKRKPRRKA